MAGKIVADQLEHSTAGSVDTQYVVDGSLKQWVNMDGSGTISVRDSLNNSSVTDNGTGNYTITHTNNFSSVNYAPVIGTGNTGIRAYPDLADSGTVGAGAYGIIASNQSGNLVDARICTGHAAGDLA